MCLGMILGVGAEKLLVFLERRTASGGVGDHGVEIVAQENGKICARKRTGRIAHARMRRKRAAAGLSRGNDDFAAVRGQHTDRRVMQRGKADLRNASGKKRHAGAAWAHPRIRSTKV